MASNHCPVGMPYRSENVMAAFPEVADEGGFGLNFDPGS